MKQPTPKPDPFGKLLDTYVEELMEMSDEEALAGADPSAIDRKGQEMLDKARTAAGRRRLDAARAKLAQQKSRPMVAAAAPVSAQEARRFLAEAANDGRYTLAARELKEMSDEEALRLYAQIKTLESQQSPPSDSP